jgi:O-antigen/teichoic acid export membrane protein
LANLRERINFRIVATDVVFNLAVGLVLIPRYQLWGAAVTFLLTRLFDFVQHYFWTARLLPNLRLVSLIWKPAAASLCMAAFLALVPHRNLLFTVLSAGTLYVLTWFALAFWSSGGAQALKARYLYGWSE